MNETFLLVYGPILVIFMSAVASVVIKRLKKDACLKLFHRRENTHVNFGNEWVSGMFKLSFSGLEIKHQPAIKEGDDDFSSTIFYEIGLNRIDCVIAELLPASVNSRWEQIKTSNMARKIRKYKRLGQNCFNVFRDAFMQSFGIILSAVTKNSKYLQKFNAGTTVKTLSAKALDNSIPNSYEPIMERNMSRVVAAETHTDGADKFVIGTLEEYTSKFIFLKDAKVYPELLADAGLSPDKKYDVILSRPKYVVRHRVVVI